MNQTNSTNTSKRNNSSYRSSGPRKRVAGKNNGNRSGQGKGKGQRTSNLNPSLLVKKALVASAADFISTRTIGDLPINPRIIDNLLKKGFERPTEIQDKTIEALLQKRDLLGIAQTGTGKTAAFLVPIIHQLLQEPKNPYALIVVPTRELANQVEDEFRSMTKGLGLYSSCFIGGTNINRDLMNLRRPSHLVIGTPGRLLDLVNRKVLDLRKFNTLVLDEFDRMLDMGFVVDVKRLINGMTQRNHTMLFSATLDKTQESLIQSILKNPVTVKVSSGEVSGDHIDQDVIRLKSGEDKFKVLFDLIKGDEFQKVLLFEETKHKVSRLCTQLNKSGIVSDEIHGNKSQNARQRALDNFKRGGIRVLVATDVAARGIDVSDITHVINYQIPLTYDSYIHRIGRTGRAGKTGKALTFVN